MGLYIEFLLRAMSYVSKKVTNKDAEKRFKLTQNIIASRKYQDFMSISLRLNLRLTYSANYNRQWSLVVVAVVVEYKHIISPE